MMIIRAISLSTIIKRSIILASCFGDLVSGHR
jgi:hypothetical protein